MIATALLGLGDRRDLGRTIDSLPLDDLMATRQVRRLNFLPHMPKVTP